MKKQLKLDGIESGPNIQDPTHKKIMESIEPAPHLRLVGRTSKNGLHEVGFLNKEEAEETEQQPVLIKIPGLGHGNWCFPELQKEVAEGGIETLAVSPPGELQSIPFNKPVDELILRDYVEPLAEYILGIRKSVILLGYSLGGLMAQQLAAELGEDKVKRLYLINTVKPSNICRRLDHCSAEEEIHYMQNERSKWLDEIYGPLKDKMSDEIKGWISQKLYDALCPASLVDNYGSEAGWVDPKLITIPVHEFISEFDGNATSDVCSPIVDDTEEKIWEAMPEDERDEKFKMKPIDKGVEEMTPEELMEKSGKRRLIQTARICMAEVFTKLGNSPDGEVTIMRGGTHGSPLIGKHAKQVGQVIVNEYNEFYPRKAA